MHTEPQPIEPLENVIYISAGWTSNMALTCGGALHCWGTLMWPGSEDRSQWTLPTRLDTTAFRSVKQIVIAKNHALLLTGDGEVFGFGAGRWGKLGNGTTNDERYPAKLGFDLANVKVEQIAAGEDHSVILTQSGEVYTFGKGSNGQLGHGNRNDCSRPTKVRHLAKKKNKIRFIAAGFDQTFCISSEGEVYSFGKAGPWLGYDVRQALVNVPKRVTATKNLKKIVSAAVGQSHTLLLAQTGEVYAMGDNKNGSLGLGEHVEKTAEPWLIDALQGHNIRQISAGAEHSLVMCEDGHVFSWGLAATGRLGCGDASVLSNVYVPQQVTGIEGRPLAVSAGLQHSLVLTAPTLSMPDMEVPTTPPRRKSVSDDSMLSAEDSPYGARSLDRSGGGSGSDSPSTTGGSGGIDTLRRGVKKVVRKRLASFSSSSNRRRGSLSQSSPNSPSAHTASAQHHHHNRESDDDYSSGDQVPYQYQQQHHNQQHQQMDYSYYAQAEMLRARLMASPQRDDTSGAMSAQMSPLSSMSPRSPTMTPRLDPKVEALLRELNYHEDESITGLFVEGRISWEALRTFTKADLAELGLPFGPRTAIYNLLQRPSPQVSQDSALLTSAPGAMMTMMGQAASASAAMTPTPEVKSSGMRARIGYDDLTFMCKLGTGAFGDVWKGKLRGTTTVAIKTLKANGDYQNFRVEAQIMAELPAHANVVTFYGVADADKGVYIVTEFVPDGSLDRYLMEQRDVIEQSVLVQMIKDVAAGMDHLATHGILHRDLAARNLLVEVKRSGYHRVKVCDFGLALERAASDGPVTDEQLLQQEQQQRLSNVPVRWTAIEVLLHGHYTTKSDVWSFGVTVWEIFSGGQIPYADLSTFEIVELLLGGYKLPRPERCPEAVYERIILRCLADDPDDRPTFHEIYRTMDALFPTIYASAVIDLSPAGTGGLRRSAPSAQAQRKPSISSFVPRLAFASTPNLASAAAAPSSLLVSSSSVPTSAGSSPRYNASTSSSSVFSPYSSIAMPEASSDDSDSESDSESESEGDICGAGDDSSVFSPYGSVELRRGAESSADDTSCDEAEAVEAEREAKQANDKKTKKKAKKPKKNESDKTKKTKAKTKKTAKKSSGNKAKEIGGCGKNSDHDDVEPAPEVS